MIACSSRAEQFAAEILALDPELDIRIAPDLGDVADIDTALVWQPPPGLLRTLPNLKLIVSVGAGVDALVGDPTLPYVPLVRFVDPDLTGRMVEYIALNVLYHHRRMAEFRELQTRKRLGVSSRAGRARGPGRGDGARRAGCGCCSGAQAFRLSGARLEPHAQDARWDRLLSRHDPARGVPRRYRYPGGAAASHARHARHAEPRALPRTFAAEAAARCCQVRC